MSRTTLRTCPACGVRVREDRVLTHKERVHPLTLTPEEVRQLEALRPKREDRTPPRTLRSRRLVPWGSFELAEGKGEEPATEEFDEEESADELPSLHEVVEFLEDRVSSRSSEPEASPELMGEVEVAMDLLQDRCGEQLRGEQEELEQERFEDACRARWEDLAEADPD